MDSRRLLTEQEVAEILRISVGSVKRMRARGVLRAVRPTGQRAVRILEQAVAELIRQGGPPERTGAP